MNSDASMQKRGTLPSQILSTVKIDTIGTIVTVTGSESNFTFPQKNKAMIDESKGRTLDFEGDSIERSEPKNSAF